MRMRKYLVREMPEAVALIRKELGKDAVILSTKPIVQRRWLGLRRDRWLEVVAAVGEDVPSLRLASDEGRDPERPRQDTSWQDLREDIEQLRELVESLTRSMRDRSDDRTLVQRLRAEGLDDPELERTLLDSAARRWLSGSATESARPFGPPLRDETEVAWVDAASQRVLDRLAHIRYDRALSPTARVVAFIGPTGVGKTTTIAKIAALHVLSGARRVGLVTADTFRIAAVDQLRTYAQILGVPLVVVQRPDEAEAALRQLIGCDLILVDTTGRSFRREEHVEEAAAWMRALAVDEVHLVLSLTAKPDDLLRVARALEPVRYHKFLFTKFDETSGYSGALKLLWTMPRPVSYFTTGQNVPDDIEVADVDRLVRDILAAYAPAGA